MLNKHEIYSSLLSQAKNLIDTSIDDVANMANLSALIHQTFEHHWVGFYRVIDSDLVLGPFQGPVACTKIGKGKGVCGKAWETKTTQIVEDVHQFVGHIACSSLSNSEIVVPCIRDNKVFAVLDLDSTSFSAFDEIDKKYLEELVSYL